MADAKRKRAAGVEPEKGDYVRLSPSVEDFMGGKRYCKESELTRCRLLAYERSQGRISEYRCVLYQQRVDGASTLKRSSRVYLVVYNIEGPNLTFIIAAIFVLRYHELLLLI